MSFKQNRATVILISTIVGLAFFVLLMNIISQPENYPFEYNIKSAFGAYFFTFSFSLGNIGYVLAASLLFFYLIVWNILGYQVLKFYYLRKTLKRK